MAYTWEPRWEIFEVEYEGMRFRTCRDRVTGLIACPICVHAASKCLGEKLPEGYRTENSFFLTTKDLVEHIKSYHVYDMKKRLKKLEEEKETEE